MQISSYWNFVSSTYLRFHSLCFIQGMHSLGNSSKWASYDSLSSTPSFLLSESDLTEDEADVFSSEGEGESGGRKSSPSTAEGGEGVSRLHLAFISHDPFRTGSGQECRSHTATYPPLGASAGRSTTLGSGAARQGDLTFSQKCTELQRFIRPLLELLNGLKTGRFERGLSSFQHSVAMDRLQRIVGILQKPDMGEKYLRTLLQVEIMLKMWFPKVIRERLVPSTQNATPSLPPRWHQNQLHIPVKKRKLSWLDSDFPSASPPHCKRLQRRLQPEETYQQTVPSREPASAESQLPVYSREQHGLGAGNAREESRAWTWGHETSDSKSRSSYTCSRRGQGKRQLQISLPSPCVSPATQDGSVSSTIAAAADSLQHPFVFGQQSPRCCGTVQAEGGPVVTSEEIQGRSLSLTASLRPLNREEESTL